MLTRDGLHDLMISYNSMKEKQIDEAKLSKSIYEFIDDITNDNIKILENKNDLETEIYFQSHFRNMLIFRYTNDNYIFWIEDKSKSAEFNYSNKKEFLECLLNNYNNLDSNYLTDLLNRTKFDLNFIKKAEKDPLLVLKESYNNYDYVKILKYNHRKISSDDVTLCIKFLDASNNSQNGFDLTIDEKICLYLIIFYGLKNMYFYSSKLYKYYNEKLYYNCIQSLQDLNHWLNFFKENIDNVSNKTIYSKEYECSINLKNEIRQFFNIQDPDFYIIRKYIHSNYLVEPLQLIYFDYLINNRRFEEARKYLDNNPIYLYSNIDKIIFLEIDKEEIVEELINEVVTDYNLKVNDVYAHINNINDLLSNSEYKNLYVIPVLYFIINYLYLLKSENKEKQVECLYSFLKIFEKGFGIDDFIVKFNYELLLSELKKINKVDKDANMEDIDNVINEISNSIEKANLVDIYDIEKIEKMYPHINFNNLNSKVKSYIATGNTIMLMFNDPNNIGFDYSSAVIEWCKAVELETYEKLTSIVEKSEDEINGRIDASKRRDPNTKQIKTIIPKNEYFIKFATTLGTFDAISRRVMKNGKTMVQYLYDNYFSKKYDLDNNTYNNLIDNILLVYDPRNKSAHKDTSIELDVAQKCQTVILSAKKILEVLSNL